MCQLEVGNLDHAKAKLMLDTLQSNDIVVGPHCRDHLLRAFGLPPHKEQPISLPRLRTLLVRHYVEIRILGLLSA